MFYTLTKYYEIVKIVFLENRNFNFLSELSLTEGVNRKRKNHIEIFVRELQIKDLNKIDQLVQTTGAQVWHTVSLLSDVTSPATAFHYVSMTSDLRVLSTEKHCPVRRQHTVYTNKSLQCKGEVHSSPLNKQGGFVTLQQWMGDLKRFPSVS